MAQPQVFLSYARGESARYAGPLHASLSSANIPAFLDSSDIEAGAEFLVRMIDELLGSTITVLFVGQLYFTRQACRRECEAALAALDVHFASDRDKPGRTAAAVRHIVVAYQPGDSPSLFEHALPRSLTQVSWLPADQTGALVKLIRDYLVKGRRPAPIPPVQRARIRERAIRVFESADNSVPAVPSWFSPEGIPHSLGLDFVGRAEYLVDLQNKLTRPEPPVVVLSGRPGSGKSTLAAEYVRRLGGRSHPGGIFWLDASGGSPELQQYEVARVLLQFRGEAANVRPVIPSLKELRASGRSVRDFLVQAIDQHPIPGSMLFVIDNLPERSAGVRNVSVHDYCPVNRRVALLVTSREKSSETGAISIALPELPVAPSVLLLTRGLADPDTFPWSSWVTIARWVGFLPLALDMLNAALLGPPPESRQTSAEDGARRADSLSPDELLSRARGRTATLDAKYESLAPSLADKRLARVVDAFTLSVDTLDPPTQRAAALLAHFGHAAIPSVALEEAGDARPSFSELTWLHQRHFLRDRERTQFQTEGSMHRLLAEYLRGRFNDHDYSKTVSSALVHVLGRHPIADSRNWPLLNTSCEHAMAVFDRYETEHVRIGKSSSEIGTAMNFSQVLAAQGRGAEAIAWLTRIKALSVDVLGRSHAFTMLTTMALADELKTRGDADGAAALAKDVLDDVAARPGAGTIMKRVIGWQAEDIGVPPPPADIEQPDATGVLQPVALSREATRWQDADPARSRALFEEAVAAAKPGRASQYLGILTLFGQALLRWGRLDEAERIIRSAVDGYTARYGATRPEVTRAMSLMAEFHVEKGELHEAKRILEDILRIRRRRLKARHPDTLAAMGDLAYLLVRLKAFDDANSLYAKLLASARKALGDAHPDTLGYASLAVASLRKAGLRREALELARASSDTACASLTDLHEARLTAESDYAFELELDGSLHAAKAIMESVQRRSGTPEGHPSKDSIHATWTLARILWKLRERGATDLTEEACRACEAVYGAGHPRCEELRRLARSRVRGNDAGPREPGPLPDAG